MHPSAKKIIDQLDAAHNINEEIEAKPARTDETKKKEEVSAPPQAERVVLKVLQTVAKASQAVKDGKIVKAANALRDAVIKDGFFLIVDTAKNTDSLWDQFIKTGKEIGEKSLGCPTQEKEEIDGYLVEIKDATSKHNANKKRNEKNEQDKKIGLLDGSIKTCNALSNTFIRYNAILNNQELSDKEKNKQLGDFTHKLIYPLIQKLPELSVQINTLYPPPKNGGLFCEKQFSGLKSFIGEYLVEQIRTRELYEDTPSIKPSSPNEQNTLHVNMDKLWKIYSNENDEST